MVTKPVKRSRSYLRPDEVEMMLTAAKKGATRNPERDTAILTLLAHHGMRVSELCDLRISDAKLEGKPMLHIRHQKGEEPSSHPLYQSDVTSLRKWLTIREGLELEHDYLFCSEQRTRISRAAVNLMIATVAKAAGLEHLHPHPHIFRSSCITYLMNEGVDLRRIQDYAGHRSIVSTSRYCKLSEERFKDFARLF